MQYVDGQTLADRLKSERPEVHETLDIVIQVVEALAEAHSHGIVHRDIKPANIMISARGQAKVLDFGLAKIIGATPLDRGLNESQSMLSRPGDRPGTPPYMSPEQAGGKAVDARGDLFAVGVILYECIAGSRPFTGETTRHVLEQIRFHNPAAPSSLNPTVPPILDTVVLKALTKRPSARYQSAEDLLKDLRTVREVLQDEDQLMTRPILPQTDTSWFSSAWTSVSITLRRQRAYAFLTVTAVVLIAGYFIDKRFRNTNRWYRPIPAAVRWYDIGTNDLREGAYFEASKALQQAVATDEKFALAHARLAESYTELDYSDKAKDEIIRAESLAREQSLTPSDSLYLKAVANTVLREFSPALDSYKLLAEQASPPEKANVYMDLGRAYEKNDQLQQAKESYQEATRLAPDEAAAFLRLGVACGQSQNYQCASEAFDKAESLYQSSSNQEGAAEVYYQRGFLLLDQKKLTDASAQLEAALRMATATGNLYQHIKILQALSNLAVHEGQIDKAKQQASEAIQFARDNHIENQVTSGLIWLGNALLLTGDYTDAEAYYQEALELAQRSQMRLDEAWAQRQLGSLRSLQHKTDEALNYLQPALAFYQSHSYRYWTNLALILVGRTQRDQGDYGAALNTFNQLLQLADQVGDQVQAAKAHLDIGTVLTYQEQYPEALRHFDEGYNVFKSLKSEAYVAYAAQSRASALWQLGLGEETRAALDEATAIAQKGDRPQQTYRQLLADIHLTESLFELSEMHLAEAKRQSQSALALAPADYSALMVDANNALALAQARAGATSAATSFCEEAEKLAEPLHDPQLTGSTSLSCAEAMLAGPEPRRALETALHAQENFARLGKTDSEWRAWLIAAQASSKLGQADAAHQYAAKANDRLLEVEQKWGSENYKRYLSRSDVAYFRHQLDRLLKPQT
jgi:tetratricopeptide (TPR) repeat protein